MKGGVSLGSVISKKIPHVLLRHCDVARVAHQSGQPIDLRRVPLISLGFPK